MDALETLPARFGDYGCRYLMAGVKGQKPLLSHSPTHMEALRSRIDAGRITNALQNHVVGNKKLTNTQVTAGLGLLRKVLPDRSEGTLEHSGAINVTIRKFGDGR